MRAGKLRHMVEIQEPIESVNAGNPSIDGWKTVPNGRVFAGLEPLSGDELVQAHQVAPGTTHRVPIRHLSGVTTKMRVLHRGRSFNIGGIVNTEEKNVELILFCKEAMA